eukprot:4007431-Pleurochrysis_carterae.AAC.1
MKSDLRQLDALDSSFGRAGSLLRGTMGRLDRMVGSKDGWHMLYLALFTVGVFLFIYKMMR